MPFRMSIHRWYLKKLGPELLPLRLRGHGCLPKNMPLLQMC